MMPKRFIASELFEKPWFQALPSKMKLGWIYLFTQCDHAGIIELNVRMMNFILGQKISQDEILHYLGDQIIHVEKDKWLLVKFLRFQYGTKFNENNRVHKSALVRLESLGFSLEKLGALMAHCSTMNGVKDKDKDIFIDKIKERTDNNYIVEQFELWWNAYDKKIGKPICLILWKKIDPSLYETIFKHTNDYAAAIEKQFRKDPERYLKKESWTDEVITGESISNDKFDDLRSKYYDE